jgi:DNA-binding LacI/PurR family transcriptional regulator
LNLQNAAWSLPSETEATCAEWTDQHAQIHVTCLGEARNVQVRHPPLETIRAQHFDGVVAMGILEDSFLDQLLELGIPVVLADVLKERLNGRIDQVFVDPLNGYQQAVERFVRMGLTRIHFVAAQIPLPAPSADMSPDRFRAFQGNRVRVDPDSYLRLSAYRQAMDACGLEVRDNFTHGLNGVLENDADLGIRLAALPEQQRPEAVVCHESTQADALIEAFERRGLPLVGAGALHTGTPKKAYPIQVDMKAVGATAMELLMSRIQRSRRPCLRVGVPMVTPTSMALDSAAVTTA